MDQEERPDGSGPGEDAEIAGAGGNGQATRAAIHSATIPSVGDPGRVYWKMIPLAWRAPGLRRATRAGVCQGLRSFLRYLPAAGCIERDRASCVTSPPRYWNESIPSTFTDAQVKAMLAAAPGSAAFVAWNAYIESAQKTHVPALDKLLKELRPLTTPWGFWVRPSVQLWTRGLDLVRRSQGSRTSGSASAQCFTAFGRLSRNGAHSRAASESRNARPKRRRKMRACAIITTTVKETLRASTASKSR